VKDAATGQMISTSGSQDPYPPDAERKHPPLSSYSNRQPNGQILSWHREAVTYQQLKSTSTSVPMVRLKRIPAGQKGPALQRIWFPDGPPAYTAETELKIEEYDDKTKGEWKSFVDNGVFAGGKMPLLPPRREWCKWNF
jgi:nucleoporin NUP42